MAELYCKALRATGFDNFTTKDKREELIAWLKGLCEAGKLWVMRDDAGPLALGHHEPEKAEVITVVVRDDMERKGYGTEMLQTLMAQNPGLKVRPVTRRGKALATKCGFEPSEDDESVWIRKR